MRLADGEWHRLHPATPLLRGGILFVAIAGYVVSQFRERLVDLFIGAPDYHGDPVQWAIDHGYIGLGSAIVFAIIVVLVGAFYVSWRMHTFRVTGEIVEVRSGVLVRRQRQARLDRIQGIQISRSLIARIFGAAKFEVQVAGEDANVRLDYLSGSAADELRGEILQLASGSRRAHAATGAPPAPLGAGAGNGLGDLVGRRAQEFLAPELDPNLAPPESVVKMHPGRLIGSTILSRASVNFVLIVAVLVVVTVTTQQYYVIFSLIPTVFGLGSYLVRRVTKSLRFTIANTPDGVRVGYGLFALSNETIPPGRIHSIEVSQHLLWRPFGWWEIRVNLATRSRRNRENQHEDTVLPVGTRDEALRVLELIMPELGDEQTRRLLSSGFGRDLRDGQYTTSPRRAALLHWFSWRRNGFATVDTAVLLRRGAIWRQLAIIPLARIQSVALHQGPFDRMLRLADIHVHTVTGPISGRLDALAPADAQRFFTEVERAGVTAMREDRTQQWNNEHWRTA